MSDDWKKMVGRCFGVMDRKFGLHAIERQHANEMLRAALAAGATVADIEAEARAIMSARGCTAEHIKEQVEHVRDLRSYFP